MNITKPLIKKSLSRLKTKDLNGKKILLRTGFDVPLSKEGKILDNSRIKNSLPTIKFLLKKRVSQIIIISHLGRPKGSDKNFSLKPVAIELSKLLKEQVEFSSLEKNPTSKIVLMENLRFYDGEENNDKVFSKKLAGFGDVYVNDSFSVAHRNHASILGVSKLLPSFPGLELEREIKVFSKILDCPERPFVVVLGGAKISTKLPVIKNLVKKADKIILGGAMIFSFYNAFGLEIGNSLYEKNYEKECKKLMKTGKILLPKYVVCSEDLEGKNIIQTKIEFIPKNMIGLDIGLKAMVDIEKELKKAKLVFWNGPLGKFENPKFAKSTNRLAKFLTGKKKVVVGGGDTVSAVNKLKLTNKYFHVSMGGGASLELLSGKKLPGLKYL